MNESQSDNRQIEAQVLSWLHLLWQNSFLKFKIDGPWMLIMGFAMIIVLGTLLLKLPWAAASGETLSWGEAFFTATSATTVTGLAVVTTSTDFSLVGQVIILFLLQIGGVGFIAFSVLLFRLVGRRINLQTRFVVQQSLGAQKGSGVLQLALYVLMITVILEGIGAFFLWLRWRTQMPDGQALWYAIFHSISSYCNAGFDLFAGSKQGVLFGFGNDWYTLTVMGLLVLAGGFGITVMYDLWSYHSESTLGLNTKFTLISTAIFTLLGLGIMLLDGNLYHLLGENYAWHENLAVSTFTIISARTAGLTIIPLEQLSQSTQLLILIWMFIGGAPASMAGGIRSSAIAVIVVAVVATARGRSSAIFGRSLPVETIAKAVAILIVSIFLILSMTFILAMRHEGEIFTVAFEVISAFSNTGYSLNFTSNLDTVGRCLIAFTMFWGRLGPLTIVIALAQSEDPALIRYPEEPVILG